MKLLFPYSKTLKLIFSFVLILLFAIPSFAQIPTPRRIKNRVNRNLEERILKKVDEAVDKVLDSVEEAEEESSEEGEGVSGEVENAEVKVVKDNSPYVAVPNVFIGSFQMKMEVAKNGRPDKNGPTYATYAFDEWQTAIMIESPNTEADAAVMIVNIKENTMTTKMNNNGELSAITMKRPRYKTTVESKHQEEEITITPTDQYENINGYRCRKYLMSSPDANGEFWITTEVDMDYENLMQSMNVYAQQKKGRTTSQAANIYGIEGFPMRTHTTMEDGQEITTEMQYVKPGQVDEKLFDLSAYKVTDLSAFGRN